MSDEVDSHGRERRDERELYKIDPFTVWVESVKALSDRVRRLEIVVYGFCGLILCSVVGIWLKLAGGK